MHRLRHLIHLHNLYMEHRALYLLHSSDMRVHISGGISAGIGDTNIRPMPVVSADTNSGLWYWSQPTNNYTYLRLTQYFVQ